MKPLLVAILAASIFIIPLNQKHRAFMNSRVKTDTLGTAGKTAAVAGAHRAAVKNTLLHGELLLRPFM